MGKLNTKINDAADDAAVLALFDTVQQTPGGETNLKRIDGKVVEVKKLTTSGEWVAVDDADEYNASDLRLTYKGY